MVLRKAKETLESGGYTCVLTDGTIVYTSKLRGVKPLVQFLESGTIPSGFSAADKVIGRATAYLYVLLGVREVYAQIISVFRRTTADGCCPSTSPADAGTPAPSRAYPVSRWRTSP